MSYTNFMTCHKREKGKERRERTPLNKGGDVIFIGIVDFKIKKLHFVLNVNKNVTQYSCSFLLVLVYWILKPSSNQRFIFRINEKYS